jgi:CheY-like chemotaxis protein
MMAIGDRIALSLARVRHANESYERSCCALARSRRRLCPMRGGSVQPMPADLSGLSLLIVENDDDNRDVFAVFLGQCGARVAVAQTAAAALEHLAAHRADAILTDVSVLSDRPQEFIERVRTIADHKTAAVIAVTGWTAKDVRPVESGLAAFVQKPVDLDALSRLIRSVVRRTV